MHPFKEQRTPARKSPMTLPPPRSLGGKKQNLTHFLASFTLAFLAF